MRRGNTEQSRSSPHPPPARASPTFVSVPTPRRTSDLPPLLPNSRGPLSAPPTASSSPSLPPLPVAAARARTSISSHHLPLVPARRLPLPGPLPYTASRPTGFRSDFHTHTLRGFTGPLPATDGPPRRSPRPQPTARPGSRVPRSPSDLDLAAPLPFAPRGPQAPAACAHRRGRADPSNSTSQRTPCAADPRNVRVQGGRQRAAHAQMMVDTPTPLRYAVLLHLQRR